MSQNIENRIRIALADAESKLLELPSEDIYPIKLKGVEPFAASTQSTDWRPLPKIVGDIDASNYRWMLSGHPYECPKPATAEERQLIAAVAMSSWRLLPSTIAKVLSSLALGDDIALVAALQARVDSLVAYSRVQLWALENILTVLRQAGVDPLLVKGTAARFHCYDSPLSRASRDIDLAVTNEHLSITWRALMAHGFVPAVWSERLRRFLPSSRDGLADLRDSHNVELAHQLNLANAGLATKLIRVPILDADLRRSIITGMSQSSYPWVTLSDGELACYLVIEILPNGGVGLSEDIDSNLVFDFSARRRCEGSSAPSPSHAITFFQIANKLHRNSAGGTRLNPFLWSNYSDLSRLLDSFNETDHRQLEALCVSSPAEFDIRRVVDRLRIIFPHLNSQ